MIARPRCAILMLTAALLLFGAAVPATAQSSGLGSARNAPCGPVPLVLLTWIRAPDKAQAAKAINELRQSIRSNINSKELCPVPREEADAWLQRSGYPVDTVLSAMDAKLLAGQVRADEFFDGEIRGFDYSGFIYLQRDNRAWLRERIPKPDAAANLSQGAKFFVEKMKDVRKEFPHVQKCYNALSDQKYADAAAAAQAGIQAYPDAVVARICLASAMEGQRKSPDERLAVIAEVLKRDPQSPRALILAITANDEKGDKTEFQRVAGQFIAIDPGNPLVEGIVERLVQWKLTEEALKYINIALAEDAENKKLLGLRFRLAYEGGRLKEAQHMGEDLARLDTALVDTQFVKRMFSAYAQDSQPEKVLAWLKRGLDKFPDNAGFTRGYAQQLMTMGKVAEAIEAYKQLLRAQPNTKEVRLLIANAYNDLGQVDSSVAWLHDADKHGDDKAQIAGVALQIGNALWTAAGKTKAVQDYDKAIPVLAFSDSVSASPGAKFLWGGSLFVPAAAMAQSLEATPSCDVAKAAMARLELAQPLIQGGGKAAPENAVQWLNIIGQFLPYLNDFMTKKKCS